MSNCYLATKICQRLFNLEAAIPGGLSEFEISGMLGLWPGGKGLLGKKHRPGWPSSGRLRPASAGCGGLNGRTGGRPSNGMTLSLGKEGLARPVNEMEAASCFLPRRALPPGPGTKSRATFRCRPFRSALSGSLFFIAPALPEVIIFATGKDSGGR